MPTLCLLSIPIFLRRPQLPYQRCHLLSLHLRDLELAAEHQAALDEEARGINWSRDFPIGAMTKGKVQEVSADQAPAVTREHTVETDAML